MIYEVGQYYKVPVVVLKPGCNYVGFPPGVEIPIMGEQHEDAEIIKFPYEHFHIDWRFVSPYAVSRNYDYSYNHSPGYEFAIVIQAEHVLRVATRRRKCKREFRRFPYDRASWLRELNEKYATAIAKKGRCPHKGFDMSTIKPDADGCVTCPLHGLRWNATTWELKKINSLV